jgi:transposase InsO family protein
MLKACPKLQAQIQEEKAKRAAGKAMLAGPTSCCPHHGMRILDFSEPTKTESVVFSMGQRHEMAYIDTGAGRHCIPDRSAFESIRDLTGDEVNTMTLDTAKKGEVLIPEGIGVARLRVHGSDGKETELRLTDALYMPDARHLLICASQAEDQGILKSIKVRGKSSYLIGGSVLIESQGGVWPVLVSKLGTVAMAAIPSDKVRAAQLWHQRMGHLGSENMKALLPMADGLKHLTKEGIEEGICDCMVCLTNKSKQLLNTQPSDLPPASEKGALLHADTAYFSKVTMQGNKYVTAVLDDKTNFCWVKPHGRLDDVPEVIRDVIAQVQREGGTLRHIRFDNATVHKGSEMKAILKTYNVEPQYTVPYLSQQNGKIEHLWDTLNLKTRPMLNGSPSGKLSGKLADFAMVFASQLRNRSPVTGRDKTPHEMWHGVKPNWTRFRTFGARAVVHIRKEERDKTDETAEEGILVSIPETTKGYGILVAKGSSRKFIVRNSVTFIETPAVRVNPVADLLADEEAEEGIVIEEEETAVVEKEPNEVPVTVGARNMVPADQEPKLDVPAPVGAQEQTPAPEEAPAAAEYDVEFGSVDGEEEDDIFLTPVADEIEGPRRSSRSNKGVPASRLTLSAVESGGLAIPKNWKQVLDSPQKHFWIDAIEKEMANHGANGTWELVPRSSLRPGVKVIPLKFVYDIKRGVDNEIIKFKARLVAMGIFEFVPLDKKNYSPVVKTSTWRALAAKVAIEDLELHHIDFKAAFLQGDVKKDEEIYLGFPDGTGISSNVVGKALKTIYGLHGAAKAWHEKLTSIITGASIKAIVSEADMVLYKVKYPDGRKAWLLVHVDDMQIAAKDIETVEDIKKKLKAHFEIDDLGEVKLWLGVEYRRDRKNGTLSINHKRYAENLVKEFQLEKAVSRSSVPMAEGTKLNKFDEETTDDELLNDEMKTKYQTLVGSLLYLANHTRPDLAASANICSRYMGCPTKSHWDAALQIGRYVAATVDYGIVYGSDSETEMYGMVDANFVGGGKGDRKRSTSGYCFLYGGGAVSWRSFLEKTAVHSTCEAEVMASALGVNESMWQRKLCKDLEIPLAGGCMQLYGDNQAQLRLMDDRQAEDQTKHIATRYFIGRDRVALGEIKYNYIETGKMIADIFTKPLGKLLFERFRAGLGVMRL